MATPILTPAGQETSSRTPVLLLKTKSTPTDGYEDYFSSQDEGYNPTFVPVLEHRFMDEGMTKLRELLQKRRIGNGAEAEGHDFGGLIFTSQRAVEAFSRLVGEGPSNSDQTGWPHLHDIPIYTVGPATTRALKAIPQTPPLKIFGEDTGNGEALAHFILDHYGQWYAGRDTKPALLFLVGEQRRDIIPKTLMDDALSPERYIRVEEEVVYGSGEMPSFEHDLARVLEETQDAAMRWAVVFSPTGCAGLLRGLGLLDETTGRVKTGERGGGCGCRKGRRQTYIATIGPTTRDYLRKTFGFEADVCAGKPSPEGVALGISKYMEDIKVSDEA